jgi:hypothetical protein
MVFSRMVYRIFKFLVETNRQNEIAVKHKYESWKMAHMHGLMYR